MNLSVLLNVECMPCRHKAYTSSRSLECLTVGALLNGKLSTIYCCPWADFVPFDKFLEIVDITGLFSHSAIFASAMVLLNLG